jgi:VWFA-related protein
MPPAGLLVPLSGKLHWVPWSLPMKCCAAVALFSSSLAFAQVPPPPAPHVPALRTQTTVVLVPALVRNGQGELIFTLKASDFRVADDGIEQRLTLDEDTGSEPLALVIAVETGRAGARKLDAYRNLTAVIGAVVGGVPHRVAVVGFDGSPRLLQDFTSDVDAAGAALHDLEPGDKGAAILDGLKFSVDLLRSQPPPYRRAILLVSESIDRGSQTTMEEALRVIGDTNTAIYSLGFSSSKADLKNEASQVFSSKTPGPAGGCMAKDPNAEEGSSGSRLAQAYDCLSLLAPPLRIAKMAAIAGMNGLQRNVPETVAQLTGGEYFHFEDSGGLVRGLMAISNHIPNRYVLSFQPQSPHPGFHSIELRLRDFPGLQVTARNSYWAESGPAATPHP